MNVWRNGSCSIKMNFSTLPSAYVLFSFHSILNVEVGKNIYFSVKIGVLWKIGIKWKAFWVFDEIFVES
jgi:hypothetical protein